MVPFEPPAPEAGPDPAILVSIWRQYAQLLIFTYIEPSRRDPFRVPLLFQPHCCELGKGNQVGINENNYLSHLFLRQLLNPHCVPSRF